MKFSKLAGYFSQLEKTASRNKMTEILARLFKKAGPTEIDQICYLSLGRLAPPYEPLEFNLAEKMIIKALVQAYDQKQEEIRKKYKEIGDLGDVAAFYDQRQTAKPLAVGEVFNRLLEIAKEAGEGSVERKINKLAQLLDDLDAQGAKYIVRIPLAKLRLGFSDKTILDALSWMLVGDKSRREEIEAAYQVRADVGRIAQLVKKKGLKGLKNLKVRVGVPVIPALCQRLPSPEKIIEKMGEVAVEPKWDGTRLQIHFDKKQKWETGDDQLGFDFQPLGFTTIFTRNLENVTRMFPDLVKAVFKEIRAQSAILDSEAVGYNPRTGKWLPFQETIKRKRKYGISQKAQEIPLHFYCFDVLFKDGQDLTGLSFEQRRKILKAMIDPRAKTIVLAPQMITQKPQEIRDYHQQQIKKGLEGIVVKKWRAPYDPGKRGYTWVKLKQEKGKKGGGLADTLDCLVMGYYRGRGKRAEFGIGAFLVGIRKGDQFLTVSKIGTGLSDEQWRKMHQKCQSSNVKVQTKPKQYLVPKDLAPDLWCNPEIVVEIEADNITKSPIHTAGYALRFPRLVRFRDDKSADQASTIKELKKLFQLQ
jgi:DNA ligase-1